MKNFPRHPGADKAPQPVGALQVISALRILLAASSGKITIADAAMLFNTKPEAISSLIDEQCKPVLAGLETYRKAQAAANDNPQETKE